MMDTIITISPGYEGYDNAVDAIKNSNLYHPATPNHAPPERRSPSPCSDRTELEEQRPPSQCSDRTERIVEGGLPPCQLRIRLEDILSSPTGITIGTDSKCDIRIAKGCSVSARHCTILFNGRNHLVARDGGSMNGTMVSYNSQSSGRRRNYESILWPLPRGEGNKVVRVTMTCGEVNFIISATDFVLTGDHEHQIRNWRSDDASSQNMLEGLNMPPDQFTEEQTAAAETPLFKDHFIKRYIGHGSFGHVIYMFNTRTGDEKVMKTPVDSEHFNQDEWQKECELLAQCSHDHIVKLLDWKLSPVPEIYLEYMRYGTLYRVTNLSLREKQLVLVQCLSALDYLHGKGESIGHRDIKPENILVHGRSNGNICVKFGDFGLAKAKRDSTMLRSAVGTPRYMAPEILGAYNGTPVEQYTVKVDIWSLGLVMYDLLCSSPRPYTTDNKCCAIVVTNLENEVERAEKEHPKTAEQSQELDVKRFLLDHMLVFDQAKRSSAADCMKAALSLKGMPQPGCSCPQLYFGSSDAMVSINRPSTLIASASAGESAAEDGSTVRPGLERSRAPTVILEPASQQTGISLTPQAQTVRTAPSMLPGSQRRSRHPSRHQSLRSSAQSSNKTYPQPWLSTVQRSTVQRSTVQRSTVQRSTVQRSTVQRSTVQSTVQRSTVQRSTARANRTPRLTHEDHGSRHPSAHLLNAAESGLGPENPPTQHQNQGHDT